MLFPSLILFILCTSMILSGPVRGVYRQIERMVNVGGYVEDRDGKIDRERE